MATIGLLEQEPVLCTVAMIRPATLQDSPAIAAIYNHYVTNTVVTFETEPVTDEKMSARVDRGWGPPSPGLSTRGTRRLRLRQHPDGQKGV